MRIVWISHSGDLFGGAERSMLEAIPGFIEKGIDVHTVVSLKGELAENLARLGIPVHIVPYTWWVGYTQWSGIDYRLKRLGRNVYFTKALYSLLKKIKPDIVVSNTLTIPAGAFAARAAGIPHVWYVHEMFGQQGHGLYFDLGEPLSLFLMNKLSARVIVNSQAVLDNLKGHISPDKLRLVYYAVEVPLQTAGSSNASEVLKLILVGRLSAGKRQEDAIRALASLIKKGLSLHLTLLGNEALDYATDLRRLARDLGVEQYVEFAPFSDDPYSHIAAADVMLMCSQGEAFGRVTIEAMKLGKPVVGARSAGTAELISDGTNGLLYETGDLMELGQKIETLYWDRELLKEMGQRAQAWARQKFSREKYVTGMLHVFQEAIGEGAGELLKK